MTCEKAWSNPDCNKREEIMKAKAKNSEDCEQMNTTTPAPASTNHGSVEWKMTYANEARVLSIALDRPRCEGRQGCVDKRCCVNHRTFWS